jgi:hypothetical protein
MLYVVRCSLLQLQPLYKLRLSGKGPSGRPLPRHARRDRPPDVLGDRRAIHPDRARDGGTRRRPASAEGSLVPQPSPPPDRPLPAPFGAQHGPAHNRPAAWRDVSETLPSPGGMFLKPSGPTGGMIQRNDKRPKQRTTSGSFVVVLRTPLLRMFQGGMGAERGRWTVRRCPQSFLCEQSPTNQLSPHRIANFRHGWKRGF